MIVGFNHKMSEVKSSICLNDLCVDNAEVLSEYANDLIEKCKL